MKIVRRIALFVFLLLLVGGVTRLLPSIVYAQPFSTDSWPLIHISMKLVEAPQTSIYNDTIFDGYNNHWPGIVLSSAVLSQVTGICVLVLYEYVHPIGLFAAIILSFYAFARRLFGEKPSALASLYLAFTPSFLVFTSAGLKEVYAYSLLFSLLLLLVAPWKRNSLITVAFLSAALAMSHFLASMMGVSLLASGIIVVLIASLHGDRGVWNNVRVFAPTLLILALLFGAYLYCCGYSSLEPAIASVGFGGIGFYALFVYAGYLLGRIIPGLRSLYFVSVITLVVTVLALYSVFRAPAIPGIEPVGHSVLLYALPILAAIPLAFFADKCSLRTRAFTHGLLFLVAILVLYSVAGSLALGVVFHRIANYLAIGLALVVACSYLHSKSKRLAVFLPVVVSLTALIAGLLVMLSIILGWDPVSFYWVYKKSETTGFNTLSELVEPSTKIIGDAKIYYYLEMTRIVDRFSMLKMLALKSLEPGKGSLLVLYEDNYSKGYVVALNTYNISSLVPLFLKTSRVYDCGCVQGFMIRG